MKVKKIALLALTALLGVSLAACSEEPVDEGTDDPIVEENPGGEESGGGDSSSSTTSGLVSMATSGQVANLVGISTALKTELLGKLEKYAVSNFLTGASLFDDSSYYVYNTRNIFPTDTDGQYTGSQPTYVTSYGWGLLSEGLTTGTLSGATDSYKEYYHTSLTSDPATLLYMNDQGSVVGSYVSYIGASYYDTKLSYEDGEFGYEWFASLAKGSSDLTLADVVSETGVSDDVDLDRPIPLNYDEDAGTATTYRIYVRTGADGLKYAQSSSSAFYNTWNGEDVDIEDYIIPYIMKWTQGFGMARATEDISGSTTLVGASAFYNATASYTTWDDTLIDLFKQYVTGLQYGSDDNGYYLDFTFNGAQTPFYAMYYLSSAMFSPIPADFIKTALNGNPTWYASFNDDTALSPVSTTLSLGPYVIEAWNYGQDIIFGQNNVILDDVLGYNVMGGTSVTSQADGNTYTFENVRYKGNKGVYLDIVPGASSDTELLYNMMTANGELDLCSVPTTKISEAVGSANCYSSGGSSIYKLNFNSCTEEEWEEKFGANGTVAQNSTWDVKPAMSNDNFLAGLSLSINRDALALSIGRTASIEFFSDAYMSDPENGVSYNSTDAHANALAGTYLDSSNFDKSDTWIAQYGENCIGDSTEAAVYYFGEAIKELVASGDYKEGDTITLELCWQYDTNIETYGTAIKGYMETAFASAAEYVGIDLTLVIENTAVTNWSDVYYYKMMIGQYDIAFGSISGSALDPFSFMEVLKSDNSGGFTLNYGIDTNGTEDYITLDSTESSIYAELADFGFEGTSYWTYDALFEAVYAGALVSQVDGIWTYVTNTTDALLVSLDVADDYSATITIYYNGVAIEGIAEATLSYVVLCWYDATNADGYDEVYLTEGIDYTTVWSDELDCYVMTITLTSDQVLAYPGNIGVDLIFTYSFSGSQIYESLYGTFPSNS